MVYYQIFYVKDQISSLGCYDHSLHRKTFREIHNCHYYKKLLEMHLWHNIKRMVRSTKVSLGESIDDADEDQFSSQIGKK
jgi:hypothetical protein